MRLMPCSRSTASGDASGISHVDVVSEPLQSAHQVERLAVAKVRHILLERQPQHQRRAGLAAAFVKHVGDPAAHAVVGAAAGEDDLRIVAELLGEVA